MSTAKIVLMIALLFSTSCGWFPDEEDEKNKIVDDRNNSSAAKECRANDTYWDATAKKCHKDVKLAAFSCDVKSIKKMVAAEDGKKVDETAAEGYSPLECGTKEDLLPIVYVTWSRKENSGVGFLTFAYIGREAGEDR